MTENKVKVTFEIPENVYENMENQHGFNRKQVEEHIKQIINQNKHDAEISANLQEFKPTSVKFTVDNPEHKPFKKHYNDAGFDVRANINIIIPMGSYAIVKTDLHVAIPEGYVGILKSRSGLACKHGIETGAGVIDASYRGYISVKLYNHSYKDYTVNIGDKISQMLIIPVMLSEWEEVDSLDETERNENGFGSTGR